MKLAELSDPNLLQSGIFPGFPPKAVPLWKDGRNIVTRRQGIERRGTKARASSVSSGIITKLAQTRVSGTNRIYAGTADAIYSLAPSLSLLGSGLGGGNWSFAVWGSWLLATNGIDPIKIWKNGGALDNLTGPSFTSAEILVKRGTHLIAMNTSLGENRIEWCSSDDVEQWTESTTTSAGSQDLRDLDGPIKAGVPLGDKIAVYSRDSMLLVSYLGSPFWFAARPAINGVGAVSKNAVVTALRKNFGLSQAGFFETDGVSFRYIDDQIKDWYHDTVNKAALDKVVSWHNERKNEVIWHFPSGTADVPDIGVGYNYKTNAWDILDFGVDAAAERQVYDHALTSKNADIFFQETVSGDSITGWIQTKPLALSAPQGGDLAGYWKFIDAILLDLSGTTSLDVYVGVSERMDETPTWSGPFTASTASPWIYPRVSGVYISLKFSGTDAWALSGGEIHGDIAGRIA